MRERRIFSAEEKAKIVSLHLQDGLSVSEICDKYNLTPTQFYDWKKQALTNLSKAFTKENVKQEKRTAEKIAFLEAEKIRQNEVIAELLNEHFKLKKKNGGL